MKNLWISIKITLAMCVVLFVGYVLVLRLVAWVASPNDGEAPVVTYNGKVVGAANVGQVFTDSVYFWGRPSNVDYNGGGSGAATRARTIPEYLAQVESASMRSSPPTPTLARGGSRRDGDLRAVRASIPTSRSAAPRFRSAASPGPAACPKPR